MAKHIFRVTVTTGSLMAPRTRRKQELASTEEGLGWASQFRWGHMPQSYKLRSWPCCSAPTRHRSMASGETSESAQTAGLQ